MISPLASKRFQQSQCGHRKERGLRGGGLMADWQKKQVTAPCGLKILDMFPRVERVGRRRARRRSSRSSGGVAPRTRAMLLPLSHARRVP